MKLSQKRSRSARAIGDKGKGWVDCGHPDEVEFVKTCTFAVRQFQLGTCSALTPSFSMTSCVIATLTLLSLRSTRPGMVNLRPE
jgi:hypothetical protein